MTAGAIGLLSLAVLGSGSWTAFRDQMDTNLFYLEHGDAFWPWTVTVFAAVRQLGGASSMAYAVQTVSTGLALLAVIGIWRGSASLEVKAAALTVGIFLATPYSLCNDGVILLFTAAWIAREGMRTGFLAWERLAVLALVIFPVATIAVATLIGLSLAPVLLWLVLLLLVRRASRSRPVYASYPIRIAG